MNRTNNPITRDAARSWFRDLMAGDPVAWSIIGGILAFVVFVAVVGFFVIRAKRRREEEWRAKRYGARKQEKEKFKKLRGSP